MKVGDTIRLTQDLQERGAEAPYLLAGAVGTVTEIRRSASREYGRTDGKRTPILEVCCTISRPDGSPMQLSFATDDKRIQREATR